MKQRLLNGIKIWSSSTIKVYITVMALGCVYTTHAQVKANFTIGPNSGCSPLYVVLTNTSTGTGTLTYQWNFGFNTGINSTLSNPSTTYPNCGSFTITLIASNGTQTDTSRKTVTVYCNPIVGFTINGTAGCSGTCVTLADTSKAGSGTIATKLWDFGDGTTSNAIVPPTHCYGAPGIYSISVQETNSFGCTTTRTYHNIVTIYPPPRGDFTAPVTSSCSAPFTVSFSNNVLNGMGNTGGLQYSWNFGDPTSGVSNTSTISNPTHTYNTPGTYNVQLIVTDINGCKDTITKPNYIVIGNTSLSIAPSVTTGCCPLPVTIKVTSNLQPISYSWDYGGAAPNDTVPQPVFTIPCTPTQQTYTITLLATYAGGCTATATTSVTVKPTPTASFILSGQTVTCSPPTTVTISNTTTPVTGITYSWTFGNGNTSTSATPPAQTYSACGTYNIKLIAKNSLNCADTFTLANAVNVNCIHANFTVKPKGLCVGSLAKFIADSLTGFSGTYNWRFGDGTTATTTSPVIYHAYNTIGCFNVTLIVKVGTLCADSITLNNIVCTHTPPQVFFTADTIISCPSKLICFKDSLPGLVAAPNDSIKWSFGDGGTSQVQNPCYQYNDTGFFTVKLTACNYGCCDTLLRKNYIFIYPPISIPNVTINCDSPYVRYFDGTKSLGADHYFWYFGDTASHSLDSSHLIKPRHVFTARGDYKVTLKVTNDRTNCFHITSLTVHIRDLKSRFTYIPSSGCAPQNVTCTNTSQDAVSQTWQVILRETGAIVYTGTNINLATTVSTPGHYAVRLIVADVNNCRDTILHDSVVIVFGFNMAFSTSPVAGCSPLAVTFTNKSTSPNSTIAAYHWDFGDTSHIDTSILAAPQHIYYQTKCYTVTLKLLDNHGCISTLNKNSVCVNTPNVNFSANQHVCPYHAAVFTSIVTTPGTVSKYTWNFGDPVSGSANTSALANPSHTYKAPGTYTVSLTVLNSSGCTSVVTKNNYIIVTRPTAAFGTPDSTHAICPPLTVDFKDSSYSKIVGWYWNFGDGPGSGSVLQNPSHIYNVGGQFNVLLIAVDSFGCADTLMKPQYIKIGGPVAKVTYTPRTGCAPLEVHFAANATNAKYFVWDYGNTTSGQLLNADTISYLYTLPGIYHAKVIIDDGQGCVRSFVPQDSIVVTGFAANSSFSPPVNCPGAIVSFKDSLLAGAAIVHQLWNFGDAASGKADTSTKLKKASHTYATAGKYIERLRLYSASCADTLRDTVVILPDPAVKIGIVNNFCKGDTAHFIDSTTDAAAINSRLWRITDNGSFSTTSVLANPTHIYLLTGNYPVTLIDKDANGCTDSVKRNVTVYNLPTIITSRDTLICAKDSLQLSASGGIHYLWIPSSYLNNDTIANPISQPAVDITYTVKVTDVHTCSNLATIAINVLPLPNVVGKPDTSVCIGSYVRLQATGAVSYIWSPATYLDSTLIPKPLSHPAATIKYILKGKDNNGCVNKDTVTVSVDNLPVLTITHDTSICLGKSIQLTATGAYLYVWSPAQYLSKDSIANPIATPPDTIKYYVYATDIHGCKNTDSVKIDVIQKFNISLLANDTVCLGNNAQLLVTGGKTYSWSPGIDFNNPFIANPIVVKPPVTKIYTVVVYDGVCFRDTGKIKLAVVPLPELTLGIGNDTTIVAGDSVQIGKYYTIPGTYTWSPTTYLSCVTCTQAYAKPPSTQRYTLTFIDRLGCKTEDSITIDVTCQDAHLFIPNAFTPEDKANNIFYVRSTSLKSMEYLRVYDRWGKLLFESHNIDQGWDGRYGGNLLEPGVYVYYMKGICLTGDVLIKKGNITLIR